jgi:restriction endonuclease
MTTPLQKGNALESAVLAIEQLILRTSPNVKEKTYRIESKKIINAVGVHHEIDLFVTFAVGSGYDSVYIFECKNWKEAVGKNEIIVFAEKIAAAGAQRGFFVAKSFTADASAQADKESRMELIVASEHDASSTVLPFGYQTTHMTPTNVGLHFRKYGVVGRTEAIKIDFPTAIVLLNGTLLNMLDYINDWATEAMNESMLTFPSGTLVDGVYPRECLSKRTFSDGAFVLNGTSIGEAEITVRFDIQLVRPAVKSHFEINGRGRVISFESHTVGNATIQQVEFIFGPEASTR